MNDVRPRLLLFDIDGTLIRSAGAGRRALNRAFQQVYGVENGFDEVDMMGRTDPLILAEVLETYKLPRDEKQEARFQAVYFDYLEEEMKVPHKDMRFCPGILQLLDGLKTCPDTILGLLTGNWRRGAYIKLRRFGIEDRFAFGAFADDAPLRTDLVPIAVERCWLKKRVRVPAEDVYVIGDTPHDVMCAKPHGASTIAVATGIHSLSELEASDPDYFFENFEDTKAVLNIFCNNE